MRPKLETHGIHLRTFDTYVSLYLPKGRIYSVRLSVVRETMEPLQAPETASRQSSAIVIDFPDGGAKAWLTVLGSWFAMIPSMGLLNSMAVLQAWLQENELRGQSEATIGWLFSAYAFFLFLCSAQVGEYSVSI